MEDKTAEMVASLMSQKVVVNPENMLYFDYARSQYGFAGDFADFVNDCIKYFFMMHGIKVVIVNEMEVPQHA